MRSMETRLSDDLLHATKPVLARGLVNHWPLVQAANRSIDDLVAQLRGHYNGSTIGAFLGQDDQRVFYNDTFDGLNFQRIMTSLDSILDHLTDPKASRMLYVGSTAIDTTMPGLRDSNDLDFGSLDPLASFWLGTPTVIAAHFDVPDNLACVVAGRRRFTLFPPDQVENLYVGPIDRTPAGPAISLADLRDPDFDRFPRLKIALEHAQVVDLGPGDAAPHSQHVVARRRKSRQGKSAHQLLVADGAELPRSSHGCLAPWRAKSAGPGARSEKCVAKTLRSLRVRQRRIDD